MSAFRALAEACRNAEKELQQATRESIAVTVAENFDDSVQKQLGELTLRFAKLRLLRARAVTATRQIPEASADIATVLENYGNSVVKCLLEQQIEKSATQGQAVRALITAPDKTLIPDMAERKENILAALAKFKEQQFSVQHLSQVLTQKNEERAKLKRKLDKELTLLKDSKKEDNEPTLDVDPDDPSYKRLSQLVKKLQLMSWLLGSLTISGLHSTGYDWLSDPENRLRSIKMARTISQYTIDTFTQDSS